MSSILPRISRRQKALAGLGATGVFAAMMILTIIIVLVGRTISNNYAEWQISVCHVAGYQELVEWRGDSYCIGYIDGNVDIITFDDAIKLKQEYKRGEWK